jgi:hypothetical protein
MFSLRGRVGNVEVTDEAQDIENTASNSKEPAMKIASVQRWPREQR